MAAASLEHLFLSYIRSQRSLPPRLKELISPYPPEQMRLTLNDIPKSMQYIPELGAIHVSLASSSHVSYSRSTGNKRLPGALFASALQAPCMEDLPKDLKSAWSALAERTLDSEGDGVDLQSILVDETERIFAVVAEKAEKNKRVRIAASDKRTSSYGGTRRRSASIDVGMMQSNSSKSSR